jgi:hypothetical protein
MGKTRLAGEIAGIAHGEGATVLHAAGAAASEVSLAAIARARAARRPTLLVVDDADRAGGEVRAAMCELERGLEECPSLVVAIGCDEAVLAGMGSRASIALPPLDGPAVRRIAALYAPEAGPGELPVDALLASSGGVPSRVHALANDWAREAAARRVDAVAGLAAAGRVEARALVAELAGSVAALQSMDERA